MSIRGKLLFMVFGIIGAFIIVAVFAVLSYLSLTRISDEVTCLRELSESTLLLRGDINGMAVSQLKLQYEKVNNSKEQFDKGFKKIEELKYLPNLDSDISNALEIIDKLQEIFVGAWNDFENSTKLVLIDAERVLYTNNVKLSAFYTSFLVQRDNDEQLILSHVYDLTSAIVITESNLSFAYDVMYEQFGRIEDKIIKRESLMILTVLAIFIVVFLSSLIISLLITKRIGDSIVVLEKGLIAVQKGDLTTP